ncbi:MAG TPA: S46 family peptidase [Bryobacteraceae bacterium]|nr:S46 family peptidase [Bryobacteraceae bacterium]HOQ46079.1 S46 family peptidase [Bryobacteraceae bacterium]HPU72810.1 S46 family peptidase [Bryobacteraceae bacterium]
MGRRLLTFLIAAVCCIHADEGLWLFNNFPKELVAKRYGYQVTDAFLDHLRLSSVRFNNGGSGSFVSPRGLLFTNHHVGSECIQKLSSAEHDYMANGFLAETEADEQKCPDLEVNVLLKMEDVTARVKGAAKPGATAAEANEQRKAEISRIESECNAKTGNRCDVVTLYSGGEYHLYQYKKYTDVRLVFAPEVDIAAFGGDPDNFTYPRYCLDFAFFRAYENGKPAQPPDYLRWSREGVKDNELVFVSGHPGTTGRLSTVAELEFARDVSYPLVLARLKSLINTLQAYSNQSEENRRAARDNLFSQQNAFKAYSGFLSGLRDPALMAQKKKQEAALRAAIDRDPEKKKEFGNSWTEVAAAYKIYRSLYKPFFLLERNATHGSDLFAIARDVLRYSEETRKPNERRLREFTDTSLPALEQRMYSPAPIVPSMEIAVIADYLSFLRKELGANDPTVRALLNNRTPAEAAAAYVNSSKLIDVEERKRLANDPEAVKNSTDGMIVLARILDGPARRYRKEYEDRIEAVLVSSAGKIALARFAAYGANEYPDATFTLRLTFARVAGYRNKAGQPVPYATTFAGLYPRATGKEPYKLPPRWIKMKSAINLDTPFNFVSTADTHGGNSGSPTVNGKGEIVGILFDGNIESLPNRFVFTDQQARSVHVASQGIVEALRNVYHARRLLAEIGM